MSTTWDSELWRWTLAPEHPAAPTGPLAVHRTDGIRVIVDESTGSVVEIALDASDSSGRLDDATAAVALDLVGTLPRFDGEVVELDDGRHRRLIDLTDGDIADSERARSGSTGAALVDPWPVDVTGVPAGAIDLSSAMVVFEASRNVLTVTAAVDPAAYPPAVAALRVELTDADGLLLAFAPFRLSTGAGRPAALAELVVPGGQTAPGTGLRVREVRP
jgi:hypothetical protein